MTGSTRATTLLWSLASFRARACLPTLPCANSKRLIASQYLLRQRNNAFRHSQLDGKRHESTGASPPDDLGLKRPLTDRPDEPAPPNPAREEQPQYQLSFTCRKCLERSSHRISKQAYHHGTTLIQCPGCKNRHLISDHLKIFSDKSLTLEDILKEKGQLLKRGTLSADGGVEFWDDGTKTKHEGGGDKGQG